MLFSLFAFSLLFGEPTADPNWAELRLVAQSVADQRVVFKLPDGRLQVVEAGQSVPGMEGYSLSKVLEERIVVRIDTAVGSERAKYLWFDTRNGLAQARPQLVATRPDPSQTPVQERQRFLVKDPTKN